MSMISQSIKNLEVCIFNTFFLSLCADDAFINCLTLMTCGVDYQLDNYYHNALCLLDNILSFVINKFHSLILCKMYTLHT